jgi:hypothetical protein
MLDPRVQTLGGLIANEMHLAITTGAGRALRFDRDVHPGQMGRQRPAIVTPLLSGRRLCWVVRGFIFLVLSLLFGNCRLQIRQS